MTRPTVLCALLYLSLMVLVPVIETVATETKVPNLPLNEKRAELIKKYRPANTIEINIDRERDALAQTLSMPGYFLRGRPVVTFKNDLLHDDRHGALREYLSLFSNSIMYPHHKLFHSADRCSHRRIMFGENIHIDRFPQPAGNTPAKFMPVQLDMHYIELLKTLGRVIAMAILEGQFLDISFDPSFYKMILGHTKIHKFDINVIVIGSPVEDTEAPHVRPYDRVSGDRKLSLTYVPCDRDGTSAESKGFQLSFKDKRIYPDMLAMIDSFGMPHTKFAEVVVCQEIFNIIPQRAFSVFSDEELLTLISGYNYDVSVKEWRLATNHIFPLSEADKRVMDNFWRYVQTYDIEKRGFSKYKLLVFVTGTSRLPIGGLKAPYSSKSSNPWFNIELTDLTDSLPTSDPYKNTLYLPRYSSSMVLRERLDEAVKLMGGISTWFASAAQLR